MLFNGPITEAARHAASTRLPQAIFVGSPHDQLEFTRWNAINGFDQIAVISIVTQGSVEAAQLDAVVREKGIVPRLHIIPPVGRGLTPTCLFNQGLKEELVSQALATAGGLMMSYTDVMENIARNYISEVVENANKETKRGLTLGVASPSLPATNNSGFTSPTSAVASPSSSSAAAAGARLANNNFVGAPSAVLTSPPSASASAVAAVASSSSSPPTLNLPNFKVILKMVADGTSHTVYTNNLWNAAAQLSKGKPFSLETGRSDNVQRATKAEEVRTLPLTEGAIVRLTHDTATGPSVGGSTPLGSPSSSSPTAASRSTPNISSSQQAKDAGSSSSPSAPTSSSAASNSSAVEIRFTLPTGAVHQLSFNPSDTLAHVRQQVSEKFLGASNTEMATYCQTNGLSQTEFTLAVAYPPKRLENTEEMNSKTIADLKLGSKFALRVVMAFVSGGGAQPQQQHQQGTITGSIGGVIGRMGGWMRGNGTDGQ